MKTLTTPIFPSFSPLFLSLPLPLNQYGQHSGKESIISTETRASHLNLRSAFESMRVRNRVKHKIRDNSVFGSPDL